ncbi:MAG TPA: GTP-binding protein [Saprospiraceae bacterium]|nr:GTP-binding protein [Saprospiraceae bacterium]
MKSPEIYIGIFGHAKHGKSTLGGRILADLGALSKEELLECEQKVIELRNKYKGNKDFNKYNVALLKRQSITEIDRSRTVFPDKGNANLPSGQFATFIDTPGHEDYLNAISYGAYQSDLAIVTIDATKGIELNTINIVRILKSFGVPIVSIAVLKMDIVGYSQIRFTELKEEIKIKLFDNLSFLPKEYPPIIPISAFNDIDVSEGVVEFKEIKWFKEKPLIDTIEDYKSNISTDQLEEVRFVIEGEKELFNIQGHGKILVGLLETGKLKKNDTLFFNPNGIYSDKIHSVRIRSIEYSKPVNPSVYDSKIADDHVFKARSIISVGIAKSKHDAPLELDDIQKLIRNGAIFSNDTATLPKKAKQFKCEVSFFEKDKVFVGKEYVLHTHAVNSAVRIYKIDDVYSDLHYRKRHQDWVRSIVAEEDQIIETIYFEFLNSGICIDTLSKFHRLTRFILRESNKIVACGRFIEIIS